MKNKRVNLIKCKNIVRKKAWMHSPVSKKGSKPSASEKQRITSLFQPLIDNWKSKISPPPENKVINEFQQQHVSIPKWFDLKGLEMK